MLERLKVTYPRDVEAGFRKRARKAFPNETMAYLLGHLKGDKIEILYNYFPDDLEKFCAPSYVYVQDRWIVKARKLAKKLGCVLLGDIHSHPYNHGEIKLGMGRDHSPSEIDLTRRLYGPLQGICLVRQGATGRLSTSLRLWGPMILTTIKS